MKDPGLIILLLRDVMYASEEIENKERDIFLYFSLVNYKDNSFYDTIAGHNSPLEVH